jgi:putative chitinase
LNETGGFKVFKENLNYTTASRLIAVFPSAFKAKYNPNLYLKNPEKLANLVYDDRLFKKGLGNIFDGDGAKFIGRGAIQITGRNNYKNLANRTGIDFLSNPELLETEKYKFISALDFWKTHKLSLKKSLLETRQIIAGNYTANPFGYSEVLKWYKKLGEKLKSTEDKICGNI